jgi:hypothetical protein
VGGVDRRLAVWGQYGKKAWDHKEKMLKTEKDGIMAQVVKWLPNKCETLSSNPVPKLNSQLFLASVAFLCISYIGFNLKYL